MDYIGVFLLGVLVGHWILLVAIWRVVPRLTELITQDSGQAENLPDNHPTIIDLDDEERYRRSRF